MSFRPIQQPVIFGTIVYTTLWLFLYLQCGSNNKKLSFKLIKIGGITNKTDKKEAVATVKKLILEFNLTKAPLKV